MSGGRAGDADGNRLKTSVNLFSLLYIRKLNKGDLFLSQWLWRSWSFWASCVLF